VEYCEVDTTGLEQDPLAGIYKRAVQFSASIEVGDFCITQYQSVFEGRPFLWM
jgi:hypothetical protein